MRTLGVETAACVTLIVFATLTFQGCGGGHPIVLHDGVNTGDPCSVCTDPHAQGPKAGDLNNGDFTVFCNSKQCKPDGPGNAVDKIAEDNARVHETNKSPSLCDVCNRPDAQGHYAGELNDNDFEEKCTKECPGFQHPGIGMQMASQQVNGTGGFTYMTCSFFLFMASMFMFIALRHFVVKNEPFLPSYDNQPDAQYVRIVA